MFRPLILTATLLAGAAAHAQTAEVTAWTDLNLRAGPGPGYPILTVIPAQAPVTLRGCLAQQSWCQVDYGGQQGWASGDYLTVMQNDAPVAVYPQREAMKVETLTYEGDESGNALAGGTLGAIAGAAIGGPVGAAVGGAIGAGAGAATTPETTVTRYVMENPVEPVYLEGEVVTGATLPEVVELRPVPDTAWSYAYVNGVPVLVEQGNRQIVYIVR
ncbi:MAG: hypothetical protein Q27BPR15_13285 [Rhodobacter sp. CACIA14H1]|nr:MAG: hypothetical protein Q27BPR15_13285 [Rhodobacter sp. CACIA14H1]